MSGVDLDRIGRSYLEEKLSLEDRNLGLVTLLLDYLQSIPAKVGISERYGKLDIRLFLPQDPKIRTIRETEAFLSEKGQGAGYSFSLNTTTLGDTCYMGEVRYRDSRPFPISVKVAKE